MATRTWKAAVAAKTRKTALVGDELLAIVSDPAGTPAFQETTLRDVKDYTLSALGWYDAATYGPLGDGAASAEENTTTLQAAYDAVSGMGGGVILLPVSTITLTAPVASRVAVDQGACVRMLSGGAVTWMGSGRGRTIIKGASNRLELFTQDGAEDIVFQGITFDNSAHGLLQYQLAGAGALENGGIARHGNSANAAIRQYSGASTSIYGCEFKGFNICLHYIGDNSDQAVRAGTVIMDDNWYTNFVQGLLAYQPEHVRVSKWIEKGGRQSLNGLNTDGTTTDLTYVSNDPGHGIYIANRLGAAPKTVVVSDVQGEDGEGSAVRVRKGDSVAITNVALKDYTRLLNVELASQLVVSNVSGNMRDYVQLTDNSRKAIEIVDCEDWVVSNCNIDLTGTNGWAFYAQSSVGGATDNRRGRLIDFTVQHDFADGVGKAPIVIDTQTDTIVERPVMFHAGTAINTRGMVQLLDCTRCTVINPAKKTPDGVDDTYLVQVGAGCVDTVVHWRTCDLDQTPNSDTIQIASGITDTRVYRDGVLFDTYTPTITPATVGDWSPTYTTRQGIYELHGEVVKVWFNLAFNTNAYTTAASDLRISLPFTSNTNYLSLSSGSCTTSLFDLGGSCRSIALMVTNNTNYAIIRQTNDNAGASTTGVAATPASTNSFSVTGFVEYRISE